MDRLSGPQCYRPNMGHNGHEINQHGILIIRRMLWETYNTWGIDVADIPGERKMTSFIAISGGTLPPLPNHYNTPNVGGSKLPMIDLMHLSQYTLYS